MTFIDSIVYFSYIPPVIFGLLAFKNIPWPGRLAFLFVSLSAIIDLIGAYYAATKSNNLHLYNIYEYFAFPIELLIVLTSRLIHKKFFNYFILATIVYWTIHLNHNIHFGFHSYSAELSYGTSLLMSIFFAAAIFYILVKKTIDFAKYKSLLLLFGGTFIFEATCSVLTLKNIPGLVPDHNQSLRGFYFYTITCGSIAKNALFLIYFITQKRSATPLQP